MEFIHVLQEFMGLEAISGYEEKMAVAFRDHLQPYCNDVTVDKAGNVIGRFPSKNQAAQKVMVFAHLDNLGFIVRKIEQSGLLQVDRLGGIPEKVLPGVSIRIRTVKGEYVDGVVAVKSHHATKPSEKYVVDFVIDLYIDVGAQSKQQVLDMGIRIGCPAMYRPSFTQLAGSRVTGTYVDNRGGCAALVDIARRISGKELPCEVYIVGTVWEEFNLRGAMMAAKSILPDFALCLDVSLAGDTPDTGKAFEDALGCGPCVVLYNFHGRGTLNGTIAHEGLYKLAKSCAAEEGIPLQEFSALGMLTDNAYVQFENGYVACLDLAFPARYTHSPAEMCDLRDLEGLAALVASMLEKIDGDFRPNRYL